MSRLNTSTTTMDSSPTDGDEERRRRRPRARTSPRMVRTRTRTTVMWKKEGGRTGSEGGGSYSSSGGGAGQAMDVRGNGFQCVRKKAKRRSSGWRNDEHPTPPFAAAAAVAAVPLTSDSISPCVHCATPWGTTSRGASCAPCTVCASSHGVWRGRTGVRDVCPLTVRPTVPGA
jgi:hypothetical protein